jgi:hypothetical protein
MKNESCTDSQVVEGTSLEYFRSDDAVSGELVGEIPFFYQARGSRGGDLDGQRQLLAYARIY